MQHIKSINVSTGNANKGVPCSFYLLYYLGLHYPLVQVLQAAARRMLRCRNRQKQKTGATLPLTRIYCQEPEEWKPVIKEFEERTGWNVKVETGSAKGDAFPAGKRRGRLGCGLWGQCGRLRGRQRVLADRQRCLDRVFSGILCDFI